MNVHEFVAPEDITVQENDSSEKRQTLDTTFNAATSSITQTKEYITVSQSVSVTEPARKTDD